MPTPKQRSQDDGGGGIDPSYVFQELSETMRNMTATVDSLLDEIHKTGTTMATLEVRVTALQTGVSEINNIVGGGGRSGLDTRLAVLETNLVAINTWINEQKVYQTQQQKDAVDRATGQIYQDRAGQWKFAGALAAGVLGLLAAIVNTLVVVLYRGGP